MSGNILKDIVRNECVCKILETASIEDKMRENRLRQRMSLHATIRKSECSSP